MASAIKLSVIIPTYNRAALLETALRKVLNQTFSVCAYEVIIVDDGSTDNTQAVLVRLSSEYANLRHFSQANQGPAAARNLGIRHAKGQVVAFTDDDCEVNRDWLRTIWREFFANPALVALQGNTFTDRQRITPFTHLSDNEQGNNPIPICNAAYRKASLEAIGGFDERFPYPHNEENLLDFWPVSNAIAQSIA